MVLLADWFKSFKTKRGRELNGFQEKDENKGKVGLVLFWYFDCLAWLLRRRTKRNENVLLTTRRSEKQEWSSFVGL